MVAVDNVASFVRGVSSLSTNFSVPDLDRQSYCEFVINYVLLCCGRLQALFFAWLTFQLSFRAMFEKINTHLTTQ